MKKAIPGKVPSKRMLEEEQVAKAFALAFRALEKVKAQGRRR